MAKRPCFPPDVGHPGIDLCAFNLPESLQPDDVAIVKGEVGWPARRRLHRQHRIRPSKTVEQIEVSTEDGRFAHVVRTGDQEDVIMTIKASRRLPSGWYTTKKPPRLLP